MSFFLVHLQNVNEPFLHISPKQFYEEPDFLPDKKVASDEILNILPYYLNNPTNNGKYTIDDLRQMEGKVLDTRMSDLRIYDGKVPTLRSQRDGVLYVHDGTIRMLTGHEALLLQGFTSQYADKVIDIVSNRHLLMQAGNAMTVNVIKSLGTALKKLDRKSIIMANWEIFEEGCTEYVSEAIGEYAHVRHMGKEDSTIPDILVEHKNNDKNSYFIEVKHCPAQSGQFVLLPNLQTRTFDFSPKNVSPLNPPARTIIEHMNHDFDKFREAGTKGHDIKFDDCEKVFAEWIIAAYKAKGVKYVITNGYKIFKIDDLGKAFNISATYRVKRSGSTNVGAKFKDAVLKKLQELGNFEFEGFDDNKLFVTSKTNVDNKRFLVDGTEYMLSLRGHRYEVRKLSNTYNANVIFSIDTNPSFNDYIKEEEYHIYL